MLDKNLFEEISIPGTDLNCEAGDVLINSREPRYNEGVLYAIKELEKYQHVYPKYLQCKKAELAIKENNENTDYRRDPHYITGGKDCLFAVMKPKYKISIKDIKLLVGEDLSESSEIDWNDDEILPLFTKKRLKVCKSVLEIWFIMRYLFKFYYDRLFPEKIGGNVFDIGLKIKEFNQRKPSFTDFSPLDKYRPFSENILGLRFYY